MTIFPLCSNSEDDWFQSRALLLERLRATRSALVLADSPVEKIDIASLLASLQDKTLSGFLKTRNRARHSTAWTLIVRGELEGALYLHGNKPLKESSAIAFEAAKRDLMDPESLVFLLRVEESFARASTALFKGTRTLQLHGCQPRIDVEKALSHVVKTHETGILTLVCRLGTFHIFLEEGANIGVLCVNTSRSMEDLQFTLGLGFLEHLNSEEQDAQLELLSIYRPGGRA